MDPGHQHCINIFSETNGLIEANFHIEPLQDGGTLPKHYHIIFESVWDFIIILVFMLKNRTIMKSQMLSKI